MANETEKPASSDTASDGDYLGYGVYADTLWARIARALAKDADGKAKLGDDPLVVGIFGEWGAGKSKLLSLVMQRAAQQSKRDMAERVLSAANGNPLTVTVPVFFQPWKYEHERHLHVPLAVHIAEALKDAWKELPSDIEQLRAFAAKTGQSAQELTQALTEAKDRFDKAKGFLGSAFDAIKSRAGAVVAGTTDVMLTSVGVPPLASIARRKIIDAMDSDVPEGVDEEDDESDAASEKSGDKKSDKSSAKPEPKQDDPWAWKDDGLGFYRMQTQLRALTRPKLGQKLLDKAGITVTPGIEFDLRINFVVFIDDLDRCLPEKAVEVLELIKTVFNLESFAFVLALDEEVVERGIGHRYRDYHFQGKKPEMPITGFEYLEKIVHLPFRLPALTRAQAKRFMQTYETQVAQPDAALRWFSPPAEAQAVPGDALKTLAAGGLLDRPGASRSTQPDLSDLALDAFDVFVPRKLIRLIELMQAVADVGRKRGRPLTGQPGGEVDVRVVLALQIIQLFQPEMYRLMRRRINAFPALLSAFQVKSEGEVTVSKTAALAGADVSDIDLYAWVGHGSSILASTEASSAAPAAGMQDHIARIQKIDDTTVRALAQQVRLPLVNQLVEYRGAQRHGFDLLKLMQALAHNLHQSGINATTLEFRPYISLLGHTEMNTNSAVANISAPMFTLRATGSAIASVSTAPPTAPDPRPRFAPRDLAGLYADWQSPEPSVQANLAGNRELPEGQVLETKAAQALLALAINSLSQGSETEQNALRIRMAQGLVYLAPFLSRADGPAYWALLGAELQGDDQEDQPLENMQALARRERWMDVRSTLGADPRWNPKRFYLPAERFTGHDSHAEPIPGFVRVPAGSFTVGSKDQSDNPPRQVSIEHDFFIASYLTTVDQYAVFVADGGYTTDKWWDGQGIAWRSMQWASKTNNEKLRQWLDERTHEQRLQPGGWAEQLAHGSRPVWGITWFEARAYVRWLSSKMASEFKAASLGSYQACLPVEAQWQRAAIAKNMSNWNSWTWPWGNSEKSARLHANIDDSKIGRASVVGLFEPNPLGLADLAGNLWEWQDNLYEDKGRYRAGQRIPLITGQTSDSQESSAWLRTDDEIEKSALPALCGGSWYFSVDDARVVNRLKLPPDYAYNYFGLRVALSLVS